AIASKEKASPRVAPPPDTAFAPRSRHGGQAAVVGAHEIEKWDRRFSGEHRFTQAVEIALIRLRGNSQVIKSQVEKEPEAHQLVIPHVFVFVQIESFEPPGVTAIKVMIVPLDQRGDRFAAALRQNQIDRSRHGEGHPIHPRTIEWIQESPGVSYQREA